MAIGNDFDIFCANLTVPQNDRAVISSRYKAITKCLNTKFYGTTSDTDNSRYYGSYGRGTAISGFSDLDITYLLPTISFPGKSDSRTNVQATLLQTVRGVLLGTYPSTDIAADHQVVVVKFSDGKVFDVLPVFDPDNEGDMIYPDASDGGSWKLTNPVADQEAIAKMDKDCNSNLKQLCRMARAWRAYCNVPIKGMLIDTLAYNFLKDWEYRANTSVYYDWMSRAFFSYLANQDTDQAYWLAPGSRQYVYRASDKFEYKAKCALTVCEEAIEDDKYETLRRPKWRFIYGTAYPG